MEKCEAILFILTSILIYQINKSRKNAIIIILQLLTLPDTSFNLYILENILLYTDGASRGNPGPGGYGALLIWGNHRKEISQGYKLTTNNRMELMAVIEGLKTIKKKQFPVTVYSDSQYVVNAVEKGWLKNWIKTNFKGGKKNADLWQEYYELAKDFTIKFIWVKGHANNPYNNRCDVLATEAADGNGLLIDEGYENGAV